MVCDSKSVKYLTNPHLYICSEYERWRLRERKNYYKKLSWCNKESPKYKDIRYRCSTKRNRWVLRSRHKKRKSKAKSPQKRKSKSPKKRRKSSPKKKKSSPKRSPYVYKGVGGSGYVGGDLLSIGIEPDYSKLIMPKRKSKSPKVTKADLVECSEEIFVMMGGYEEDGKLYYYMDENIEHYIIKEIISMCVYQAITGDIDEFRKRIDQMIERDDGYSMTISDFLDYIKANEEEFNNFIKISNCIRKQLHIIPGWSEL